MSPFKPFEWANILVLFLKEKETFKTAHKICLFFCALRKKMLKPSILDKAGKINAA